MIWQDAQNTCIAQNQTRGYKEIEPHFCKQ